MNKLTKAFGLGALLATAGCKDIPAGSCIVNGHYAEAINDGYQRKLIIYPGLKPNLDGRYLIAEDFGADGRFDSITLPNIEKGNSLEIFVDLDLLEKVYAEATKSK